jgi:predicted RNA-binding protein with RPS1 domain
MAKIININVSAYLQLSARAAENENSVTEERKLRQNKSSVAESFCKAAPNNMWRRHHRGVASAAVAGVAAAMSAYRK